MASLLVDEGSCCLSFPRYLLPLYADFANVSAVRLHGRAFFGHTQRSFNEAKPGSIVSSAIRPIYRLRSREFGDGIDFTSLGHPSQQTHSPSHVFWQLGRTARFLTRLDHQRECVLQCVVCTRDGVDDSVSDPPLLFICVVLLRLC